MLVAKTGLLDGHKATTNKLLFKFVTDQRQEVDWIPQARWVESGKFFTASGVSAGMDMSLALINKLYGLEAAEKAALHAEYDWHRDASWDPFAVKHGLVDAPKADK
jgi:transcriptional regulator GlxA family with amidase domain